MLVNFHEITQADLKESNLAVLNSFLRQIVEELSRLGGLTGSIAMLADLNMQGRRITNLGASQDGGDAISKADADKRYVTARGLAKSVEATGTKILQTTRRLNDNTQRERASTFLNDTGIGLAQTNNSTISVAASGGNSIITLTAGSQQFSDKAIFPYPQRQDTVANPASGSNFYYYYFDQVDKLVKVVGPFTADNSLNRIEANRDGRSFLGAAQVNAGGGGGTPPDPPGCCEIGSTFNFYPGSSVESRIQPCDEWIEIELADGKKLAVATGTLVSVFVQAQALYEGMLVEIEGGSFQKVVQIRTTQRASHKVVMKVEPGHVYIANGLRVHNTKL